MNSTKVFVASTNPVKILASKNGFQKMFPDLHFMVSGLASPSGVPPQPMSDSETVTGATNRITHLQKYTPDANYWVGIEGGVERAGDQITAFAWVVIKSKTGFISKSRTATFLLPDSISRLVIEGMELGDADDIVFSRSGSKRTVGSVGILTDNLIPRAELYEPAVILALIPFKNPTLY